MFQITLKIVIIIFIFKRRDCFFMTIKEYIKTRCLNFLGVPGNGNTWTWLDTYELHPTGGAAHCGSNTEKQSPK